MDAPRYGVGGLSEAPTATGARDQVDADERATCVRPTFVTLNLIALCLAFAAWRAGFFAFSSAFAIREIVMLAVLVLYGFAGFWAAFAGRWKTAAHIANGTPMFALAMTGVGMLLATVGLKELTPQALAHVFRDMVLAISPNILGVFLLAWLRELAFWCGHAEI